ncbi:tetratricopeptide repeat protein [Pedobacter sp. MW01-1-1]
MQNLTARYNYLYNANVILTEYNEAQLQTFADDYNKILPVYLDPEPQVNLVLSPGISNKQLDDVITKGQAIVNDKSYSNYLDDAYMLMGRANYLKGNYFIAAEYFDYVAKTYQNDSKAFVMALNWKVRCQMELNNLYNANKITDTLSRATETLKSGIAEPLATMAQLRIYQKRYKEAISLLESAIGFSPEKQLGIRWRFILAQLQEHENNLQDAYQNFIKVEKSNAPFEMYFHANLNRIKLKSILSGEEVNKEAELEALLKDDKNFDYIDQIYFHVGELYASRRNYVKAEENYQKSIKNSSQNQNQKALSYLRIADINFKEFKNYIKAKEYYDLAVAILPKNYPDYESLAKKAANLQYLTDRYSLIAKEDTLQAIAKLPVQEHEPKIKAYLAPRFKIDSTATPTNQQLNDVDFMSQQQDQLANNSDGMFYFNNAVALSNGMSDFKKRWGNRQLEDNWRQSVRSAAQQNNDVLAGGNIANKIEPANGTTNNSNTAQDQLEKEYLAALPTNPQLVESSNGRIIEAYFDIANFYQQELNDKEEANKVYLELVKRFPNNAHADAIYYSLYLNYKGIDEVKSNTYKNLILTNYPYSTFAKTINDPNYSIKQNEIENTVKNNYNAMFDAYEKKNYAAVIALADENIAKYPYDDLVPQFAYLRSIAIGRTSKVDALLTAFNSIVSSYPNDQLIVPLVKDHLKYIEDHLEEFKKRRVALIDFDLNEPRFIAQATTEPTQPAPLNKEPNPPVDNKPTESKPQPLDKPVEIAVIKPVDSATVVKDPVVAPKPASIFSTVVSDTYYFVIDVADVSITLSSSRFGIGQFNRGNYPDNNLAHKLIELDEDQLIYVNSFVDLEDAKIYEQHIKGQLKNIMKVPADKYRTFIISKENFDKLKDRTLVNQYIEFYQNNYQ